VPERPALRNRGMKRIARLLAVLALTLGAGARAGDAPLTLSFDDVRYTFFRGDKGDYEFHSTDVTRKDDVVAFMIVDGDFLKGRSFEFATAVLEELRAGGTVVQMNCSRAAVEATRDCLFVAWRRDARTHRVEAAFVRFMATDGGGLQMVGFTHRMPDETPDAAVADWLGANQARIAHALVDWRDLPSPAALIALGKSPPPKR
jgi:hypothetical protein